MMNLSSRALKKKHPRPWTHAGIFRLARGIVLMRIKLCVDAYQWQFGGRRDAAGLILRNAGGHIVF